MRAAVLLSLLAKSTQVGAGLAPASTEATIRAPVPFEIEAGLHPHSWGQQSLIQTPGLSPTRGISEEKAMPLDRSTGVPRWEDYWSPKRASDGRGEGGVFSGTSYERALGAGFLMQCPLPKADTLWQPQVRGQ